eukprot:TRINITY_DN7962_c0_g1_i3.p1 TRINITY_DN7962_c0_g1~~TRINITY_DN7962_c0_g1_i3.p1  ORF type:complete len:605 (-),score=39.67 TRINITY_DN7962_c0_g1_i3:116-1930(-)
MEESESMLTKKVPLSKAPLAYLGVVILVLIGKIVFPTDELFAKAASSAQTLLLELESAAKSFNQHIGNNQKENLQILPSKSRYNFASFDGGSRVLASNPESIAANAILKEEGYMLNDCRNQVWFVLSLTEDILFDTLMMKSFENYASYIEEFDVFGSVNYPTSEWVHIGRFKTQQTKSPQTFDVNPTWVRFIFIHVIKHYEGEDFCILNQIRVYGQTMLNSFKEDFEILTKEINDLHQNFTDINRDMSTEDEMLINEKDLPQYISSNQQCHANNFFKIFSLEDELKQISTNPALNDILYSQEQQKHQVSMQPQSAASNTPKQNKQGKVAKKKKIQKMQFQGMSHYLVSLYFDVPWKSKSFVIVDEEEEFDETFEHPPKFKFETPPKDHHPLESVFSRLTKHVKYLEVNQVMLSKFIDEQNDLNEKLIKQIKKMKEKREKTAKGMCKNQLVKPEQIVQSQKHHNDSQYLKLEKEIDDLKVKINFLKQNVNNGHMSMKDSLDQLIIILQKNPLISSVIVIFVVLNVVSTLMSLLSIRKPSDLTDSVEKLENKMQKNPSNKRVQNQLNNYFSKSSATLIKLNQHYQEAGKNKKQRDTSVRRMLASTT